MSNIVSLANVQVPAHLAQRVGVPSVLSQSLSGGISGGGESVPRISIKGSRFRIVEGTSETVLDTTSLVLVRTLVCLKLGTLKHGHLRVNHHPLTASLWTASRLTLQALTHRMTCAHLAHRTHGVAR